MMSPVASPNNWNSRGNKDWDWDWSGKGSTEPAFRLDREWLERAVLLPENRQNDEQYVS